MRRDQQIRLPNPPIPYEVETFVRDAASGKVHAAKE